MEFRPLPNVFEFRNMEDLITPSFPFDRLGLEQHEGLLDCTASHIAVSAKPTPFAKHPKLLLNWQLVAIDTKERQSLVFEVKPVWTRVGFQSSVAVSILPLEKLVQDSVETFWWRKNLTLWRKDLPKFKEIVDYLDTQEAEEMIVDAYTQENTFWWAARLVEKLAKRKTSRTPGGATELSASSPMLPPTAVNDFTMTSERWFQTRRSKYYMNRGNEEEVDMLMM